MEDISLDSILTELDEPEVNNSEFIGDSALNKPVRVYNVSARATKEGKLRMFHSYPLDKDGNVKLDKENKKQSVTLSLPDSPRLKAIGESIIDKVWDEKANKPSGASVGPLIASRNAHGFYVLAPVGSGKK